MVLVWKVYKLMITCTCCMFIQLSLHPASEAGLICNYRLTLPLLFFIQRESSNKRVQTKRDIALVAAHKRQSDTHYGNKITGH